MTKFNGPGSHIHPIVRGLLVHGDEIILCRTKGSDWFFLPGGHIEDGESARNALLRELHEEIGVCDYKINSFVGVCENIFKEKNECFQHEINFVFKVDVPQGLDINSNEDHIEFISIPKEDLEKYKILPEQLKEGILEWIGDEKPFLKEFNK